MNFNKKQLEIIAFCLANLEHDCENKNTKKELQNIISNLQEVNIWGRVDFFNED